MGGNNVKSIANVISEAEVYEIECKQCFKNDIGETSHDLKNIIHEHKRDLN